MANSGGQDVYEPLGGLAVITCAVMEIEVGHFAKGLGHVVHVEMLPQGLHNEPDKLRRELQSAVDRVEARDNVRAIALVYGLCSRGVEGVTTRRCPFVIPRAHDCITLLLGDAGRYAAYVREHPGTYWYSPGWNKHHVPPGKKRYDLLLGKYREQYGDENAEYLMETEQNWFKTYDRATYVEMGVGATPEDVKFTQDCADWLKWSFDHQRGDPGLLRDLLAGKWDSERFLVLQPGQTIRMTAGEGIIEAVDASPGAKT